LTWLYADRGKMKPQNNIIKLDPNLVAKCRKFAEDSIDTNIDAIAFRGQDPEKTERILNQITHGKVGEEATYNVYSHYYPQLSQPDHQVYQKKDKSWEEDLIDTASDIRIGVKTKRAQDAKEWGASWIFELTDKKIFGSKLDGQNLDPRQYVSLVVVDLDNMVATVEACVHLQWLHDNDLFGPPDRDYLDTKLTVRLDRLQWWLKRKGLTAEDLWQLKI
jgi:hypothetical protein